MKKRYVALAIAATAVLTVLNLSAPVTASNANTSTVAKPNSLSSTIAATPTTSSTDADCQYEMASTTTIKVVCTRIVPLDVIANMDISIK